MAVLRATLTDLAPPPLMSMGGWPPRALAATEWASRQVA